MIIGIDGNEANVKTRVGVGWYVYYLLTEFKKIAGPKLQFRVFVKEPPLDDLPKASSYFNYQIVPKRTLWSQIDLPTALFWHHRDLSVFLSPAHYSPRFCPCPTVVVVHDLSYFYYPQDFLKKDLYQLVNWTAYSLKKAQSIIAVSQLTKKDIVKNYGLPESKIRVVYNGFSLSKIKAQPPQFKINKPYFLYLGTLQPRKNIHNLILGFEQLLTKHPEQNLYLVGKKGWLYEGPFEKVRSMKLEDKVIFTGHISDEELIWYYKNAFCLVLPSLYEGFGIPVLEAMSYSCPTVLSMNSSLPEIGGDASIYFDPKNSDDLLKKLSALQNNDELRKELISKGKQRIKNFSWKKCGQETLEIIKNCAPTTI